MSRRSTKDANPNVVVNYEINAPKKAVYQAFLKYVWEEIKADHFKLTLHFAQQNSQLTDSVREI